MRRTAWTWGRLSVAMAVMGLATGAEVSLAQERVDLPAADRRLNADFDEVFRVGAMDGADWEIFGDVSGAAFDAAGNLYVFDQQSSRIVMVDSDGNFVREIGQPGEGPGEFRMPMDFTVLPDGRVIVGDLGHRAFHVFAPDGSFERMVAMGADGVIRLGGMSPYPDGVSILEGGGSSVISMDSGPGTAAPTTRPIEVLSLEGERVEARRLADGWLPPRGEPTTLEGGGMRLSMSVAGPSIFEPALLVGALPDGSVAFADSSTYTVKVVEPDGRVSKVFHRSFEPEPVTARIEEAERERRLAELEAGEGPQMRMMVGGPGGGTSAVNQDAIKEMMRNRIAAMEFYSEIPVLMGMRSSWSGNLWLQRRGDEPTAPGPIDVVTPVGEYVGTFPVGSTETPSAFGPNGLAAFVETDEFDVPTVVVRRLPERVN